MINVRDLEIRGRLNAPILGGVSVGLEPGQALAAIGGSGAGKTTRGDGPRDRQQSALADP